MISAGPSSLPLLRDGVWRVDRSRSQLGFSLRHLGVATVRGTFAGFGGELVAAADGVHIAGRVETGTVDTGEPVRDERLRDELFASDRFPQIELVAHGEPPVRGEEWRLPCTLTIRGVARPLMLLGSLEERGDDVRVVLDGVIRRSEYGLDWPALGEAARLIADRVRLRADVLLTHTVEEDR